MLQQREREKRRGKYGKIYRKIIDSRVMEVGKDL